MPLLTLMTCLTTACGINFSILSAHYHEFQGHIIRVKKETKHKIIVIARFRSFYHQLWSYVERTNFTPVIAMLFDRVKIVTVMGAPLLKALFVKLEKAIRFFNKCYAYTQYKSLTLFVIEQTEVLRKIWTHSNYKCAFNHDKITYEKS